MTNDSLSIGVVINTVPVNTPVSDELIGIATQIGELQREMRPSAVELNVVFHLRSPRYGLLDFSGVRVARFSESKGLLVEAAVVDMNLDRRQILDLLEQAVGAAEVFIAAQNPAYISDAWRKILRQLQAGSA